MQDTPVGGIARWSRLLNLPLCGCLPIALILAGAILWDGQRVIKQEEERLRKDFAELVDDINEQQGSPNSASVQARPAVRHDAFWLSHRDSAGTIEDGPAPVAARDGMHRTANGLVLKITDGAGLWTGYYRIGYRTLLRENPWLLLATLLLLLVSAGGYLRYRAGRNRRVMEAAPPPPPHMADSEQFNHALAQARRDADQASAAKAAFLATLSREIRTPLNGVLGTLELMGMTALNPEQRQQLERIQNASVTLLQLISDILDITKIESGQLTLESGAFSPRELVESCTRAHAARASQKQLLLFACVDASVAPWVTGDAARLRQILDNLVSNAIRFTESGHVIVRLRGMSQENGAQRLTLQVADSGIGIGKKDQATLFSPFHQIDGASHIARGAGLGLSICANLAKLMDGRIRVTSEIGLGSSFSLDLTLMSAEGPALAAPDLAGVRILVRSPHRELTGNVCDWLAHWGGIATPASYPLARGEPGMVFVDVLRRTDAEPVIWAGHYLCADSLRAADPARIDAHDIVGIGFAVQRLTQGGTARISPSDAGSTFKPQGLRALEAEGNPIHQATLRAPPPHPSQQVRVPARYRSMFLETMNGDLSKLESAVAKRDVQVALDVLHRMRGAMVMVQMTALSACAEALEAKLKRGGQDENTFQQASRLVLELRHFLVQV